MHSYEKELELLILEKLLPVYEKAQRAKGIKDPLKDINPVLLNQIKTKAKLPALLRKSELASDPKLQYNHIMKTTILPNVTFDTAELKPSSLNTEHMYKMPVTIQANPTNIEDTLVERGSRYGKFTGHARITQRLKSVMQDMKKWDNLEADQKEALEMIVHKIGRILNGDPNYADSWVDIAGYAKLVGDRLLTGNEI